VGWTFDRKPDLWLPGIRRDLPLARELRLFVPFTEPSPADQWAAFDFVHQRQADVADRVRQYGPVGAGAAPPATPAAGSKIQWDNGHWGAPREITVAALLAHSRAATTWQAAFCRGTNLGNAQPFTIQLLYSGGNYTWLSYVRVTDGSDSRNIIISANANAFQAGETCLIVLRLKAGGAGYLDVYGESGHASGSTVISADEYLNGAAYSGSFAEPSIGNWSRAPIYGYDNPYQERIYAAWMWYRALSEDEVDDFVRDPWALIRPPRAAAHPIQLWIPYTPTEADSLRLTSQGAEIKHLHAVGALPGVVVEAVAAKNGPGVGRLRSSGDGTQVAWKAPGSSAYGTAVTLERDRVYLLEDGDDADKWIRIRALTSYVGGPSEARVVLEDRYANGVGHDDVTAAEASAGNVATYQIGLHNASASTLTGITVWLDPATVNLEISADNSTWVAPTSEATGLAFADLPANSSHTLYLRRTITAGAAADPAVLVRLHLCFTADAVKHYGEARGLYRIFNDAEYRFYRSNVAPPQESDTPFATSATLPYEPPDTFADGTWYLSVSYFNGVLDSGFLPLGPNGETYLRLDLSGGQEINAPPNPPNDWRLEKRPNGVLRIVGIYLQTGNLRADEWAIAYTTDGTTPATDSPDVTVAMGNRGIAILTYDLPAQSDQTVVKVRVQTRRNDGTDQSPQWVYSENSDAKTITADARGPRSPVAAERWTGRLPEDL